MAVTRPVIFNDAKADAAMWQAWNDFHYLCDTARMQKLFARHRLFLEVKNIPGHVIDAGVFKGTSTLQFAHMLKTYAPNSRRKVIGFDTFDAEFADVQEFEADRAKAFMSHHEAGLKDKIEVVISGQELASYCELVAGDVTATLPAYVAANRGMRVSLLHLDLDVLEPTLAVLRAVWDIMTPGGLIVLDEYGVEGWGESDAVDTFFRERNIRPSIKSISDTATPTAVIRV